MKDQGNEQSGNPFSPPPASKRSCEGIAKIESVNEHIKASLPAVLDAEDYQRRRVEAYLLRGHEYLRTGDRRVFQEPVIVAGPVTATLVRDASRKMCQAVDALGGVQRT